MAFRYSSCSFLAAVDLPAKTCPRAVVYLNLIAVDVHVSRDLFSFSTWPMWASWKQPVLAKYVDDDNFEVK
jgi:hypothetical protein